MADRTTLSRKVSKTVRTIRLIFFASTLAILHPIAGFGQTKPERQSKAVNPTPATPPTAASVDQNAATAASEPAKPEEKPFKGMKYRLIGPFRGGRSLTAAGIPGDPTTYYFGGTGGGVWKSVDGAMTWSSLFDKEGTSSIGSIAVANSNPSVIYVGTGEACIRGNISHGDGVYKSLDGARPGRTLACATVARSAKSSSTPRIQILFSSQPLAIHTVRTLSAAFFAPATAVRPGKRFFTRTRTLAASMLRLIRTTLTFCLQPFGRRGARRGVFPAVVRVADFTARPMGVQPGSG